MVYSQLSIVASYIFVIGICYAPVWAILIPFVRKRVGEEKDVVTLAALIAVPIASPIAILVSIILKRWLSFE